jgi:hypothetical protein
VPDDEVATEAGAESAEQEHEDPKGTMVLLLLFLLLIAAMWIWAYYSMIIRG